MQLEEARANKKIGEDDPALTKELEQHKGALEAKFSALFDELKSYWCEWDNAKDSDDAAKRRARDKMVDLLNRRSYIRNLVRDVNEVLEN
jgi:molecular chaperone HscB